MFVRLKYSEIPICVQFYAYIGSGDLDVSRQRLLPMFYKFPSSGDGRQIFRQKYFSTLRSME